MKRSALAVSVWFARIVFLVIAVQFLAVLPATAQQAEHDRFDADHPGARAAWFAAGRQTPAGSQPRAWYYMHAWQHAQMMPRLIPGAGRGQAGGRMSAQTAALAGNWTELGPRPENSGQYGAVAGRVTAIAVDNGKDPSGNTVYLGTAYGGLWKSTNALSANPTFMPIGDSMPTLAVGAIALDSSTSPTTIYVGTGEPNQSQDSYYGVGILKSADGGQTWTTVSGDNAGHTFFGLTWSRILIDPANPNVILAAASFSGAYFSQNDSASTDPSMKYGIFVSTDGGVHYSPSLIGPPCTDLVYDSQSHTYYAAFAGNGVWSSSDQGKNWKQGSSPFANGVSPSSNNFVRASLAVRNGTLSVLISGPDAKPSTPTVCPAQVTSTTKCDTGLAQSSDGGKTWTPIAIPGTKPNTSSDSLFCASPQNCQGFYDQYVAMPAGGADLVIGGIDAFRMSGGSDLSATWTNLTQSYGAGTVHPDEHAFASNADGSVWFIGNDGGIWRSTDRGASWTNLNARLGVIQFTSVSADLGQNGVYFGGSQDNGTAVSDPANHLAWNLIWGGDGGYTFDNPAQTTQYFTENPGFAIFRSNDGGKNFTDVVDSGTISDPAEFYVPYALSGDFSKAYVATTRVWQGPVNPTSPGTGWQVISGDLKGASCGSSSSSAVLSAIAVAPSDPNYVYVGSNQGWVSVSKDATAAQPVWQGSEVGWCAPVSSIAVDPANPLIAYVTKQGMTNAPGVNRIFVTTDGGQTWRDISTGLPNSPVNTVVIDPGQPQDVFIGTDTGVFVTSDGANSTGSVSWEALGSGLPATAVLQLKLAQENGVSTLIAATHGRGAWAIPATAPPNFSLSADPSAYLVPLSASQFQFTVHVKLINGSTAPVQLQCASPFGGDTCSLSANTVSSNGDVTVTVNRALASSTGNLSPDQIVVSGQDATHQHSLTVVLNPEDFSIGIQLGNLRNLEYGGSLDLPVGLSSPYGWDAAITLDCPGLPAGMTCTAKPDGFASLPQGNSSATLTLAAASNASAASPFQFTVEGVSGTTTKKDTVVINLSHFSLKLPQGPINVIAQSPQFTTTVTASSLTNSQQSISLACENSGGLPLGCSFSPSTIQPGQSSTLTVTGYPHNGIYGSFSLDVKGTAGNDSTVSAPVQIRIQDFELSMGNGLLLAGADSYTDFVFYDSSEGYSTPLNLSCSADQGVQCSVVSPTVSGSGNTQVTLTHLAPLAVGTKVHVTVQANNGDFSRQFTQELTVADFQIQPLIPSQPAEVDVVPGYLMNKIQLEAIPSTPGTLSTVTFACPANAPVHCSVSSMGSTLSEIDIDARDYARNGGTLPVHLTITATATQDGTNLMHSLDLPVYLEDFSLSPPDAPLVLKAGKTGVFSIQLNAIHNYQNDVSIQCTGVPAGATCKPITQFFNVPGRVDFQVTTTAASSASSAGSKAWLFLLNDGGNGPHDGFSLVCGLLGLVMLAGGWQWRRRRSCMLLQCGGLALLAIMLLACGGGGGGGYTPPPGTGSGGGNNGGGTSTPTPAGTSVLTITAIHDDPNTLTGPVHIVRTTQVTLTVQ